MVSAWIRGRIYSVEGRVKLIIEKLEESPIWRLVAFAILSAILGWSGSGAVAWYHGEPTVEQEKLIAQHEKRLDAHDHADQDMRESLGEIRGALKDMLEALQKEDEARRHDDDKMDERVRYLERHH